jgi:hypothetical protein
MWISLGLQFLGDGSPLRPILNHAVAPQRVDGRLIVAELPQ